MCEHLTRCPLAQVHKLVGTWHRLKAGVTTDVYVWLASRRWVSMCLRTAAAHSLPDDGVC